MRNSFEEGGKAQQDHGPKMKGHLITSLHPLRIHSSQSRPPRAPSLQECELLIRQLYNANSLQSQEVSAYITIRFLSNLVICFLKQEHLRIFTIFSAFTSLTICRADYSSEGTAQRNCFEQENHSRKLHSDQIIPH